MQPNKRDVAQDQDKYIVRLPDGMRDEIKAAAATANRSMNAEIVARLSQSGIGGGKTLRDEFAIAALAGHLASLNPTAEHDPDSAAAFARSSYQIADAMLSERQNGGAA